MTFLNTQIAELLRTVAIEFQMNKQLLMEISSYILLNSFNCDLRLSKKGVNSASKWIFAFVPSLKNRLESHFSVYVV